MAVKAQKKTKTKVKAKKTVAVKTKKVLVKAEAPLKKIKAIFKKKDFDFFQEKLFNVRDDLLAQIREISDETLMKSQKDLSGDMSGYSLHMADVATDNFEREFNIGLVSDDHKILFEIEDALVRIKEKTYGVCEMCLKPIGKVRLSAIPYAKFCKKCKEQSEKDEPGEIR